MQIQYFLAVIVLSIAFALAQQTPQFVAVTCRTLETTSQFQLDSITTNGTRTSLGNLTRVGIVG